eukprot:TRINITY_DN7739_c0_g1_i5.p1 TRINITY_DN7739_c0_g1~~TRINITY_DN7739_c0_g1_i5.p1  ORF type:complete len:141 (+),score=51.21 TRINITY_DN7739_c0_g1_i5:83-505(+)
MALKQERETRAKLLAQIADLEAAQQQALAEAARLRKDAARKAQQLNVTTTVIEQIESTKREIEARAQMLEDEIATSSSHSAAEREQLEMQKAELQATTAELQTNLSVSKLAWLSLRMFDQESDHAHTDLFADLVTIFESG